MHWCGGSHEENTDNAEKLKDSVVKEMKLYLTAKSEHNAISPNPDNEEDDLENVELEMVPKSAVETAEVSPDPKLSAANQ